MLLISSMGGCASTMIVNWFSKRTECNCPRNSEGLVEPGAGGNQLGLKHRIIPPLENDVPMHRDRVGESSGSEKITRAIFIFEDPRVISLSLFERKIASGHALAITGTRPNHNNQLDRFLQEGIDSFRFSEQFANWSNAEIQRPYFRMLVRGSQFWDLLPVILSFAGLPENYQAEFPPKRARANRYDELDTKDKDRLDEIYRNLSSSIEGYPDCVII